MKFILVSLLVRNFPQHSHSIILTLSSFFQSIGFFSVAFAAELSASVDLSELAAVFNESKGLIVCPPEVTAPPVTTCPHCEICPTCPTITVAPTTRAPCGDDIDRVMSILKSSSNSGFDIKIRIKSSSKSKTKWVGGGKRNKNCDCNNNSSEGCC